ncbi:cellulase [Streptomyces sp. Je 1-4]|uniref:cellulase n=1 Tax=Streptomyces TaxID=1883 RepID=UPI00140F0D67|nr:MULTISPECIES: cellulase [unclassified Streptomyces]QIK09128.1 cellulase [Streptomyces sp. ID38640]UYB42822.1 cellulase [Streptomyces sp. Je 1-4]UZQ39153.1 cellulase [Streptomyces sp. Je 1-4] [Streptomyces sp. Je 1-4 4N24]UZQ46570.1 cellulase [Streptomyces sp. Je 1-4] [Streptomyces sp. Je 1-4 4N24_ara]
MEDFEHELARMMRDTQANTPFEDQHRQRLQAGVRARRRARTVWVATGSALTIAGLGVGLEVLPSASAQGGPTVPHHQPTSTTAPVPLPTRTCTTVPVHIPTHTSTTVPVPMPTRTCTTAPAPIPTHTSKAK